MSKTRETWQTASMKLRPPIGQLSDMEKKFHVIEAFRDPKQRGLKDEVSDFFTETSFTALVRIYKATSLIKRLMWTFVVLFMVSWLVVQCYWLLDKYFKYPIEVKMDFTSANQLEFPSVTVCNVNPILESKLEEPVFEPLRKYKELETEDLLYQQTIENWYFSGDCASDQYQCSNGQCIAQFWKCDGVADCTNNDDETGCEDWDCGPNLFKCLSNKCIPESWECDNYADCPDLDDEHSGCPNYNNGSHGTGSSTTPSYHHHISGHSSSSTTTPGSTPPSHLVTTTDFQTVGKKRRKKRDAWDFEIRDHQVEDDPDSSGFFRTLLAKAKMRRAHIFRHQGDKELSRKEFLSYIEDEIQPLLEGQREKIAYRKRMKESLNPASYKKRRKRSAKDSREAEEIDWDEQLAGEEFNKWNMLTLNSSSNFYTERDDEYEATMTYAYITALMNKTEVEDSGHAKIDFIASCKFGGYQCSPENFTSFHNYKYGNCFTFNTIGHNVDLTTKFPGPSNGLILELFLNTEEYVANLSPGQGARVTVHRKGTAPFPEDEGFSVTNGISINIGMRQVKMSRVPPPYGLCRDLGDTEDYYMTHKGFKYSKLSCLKSCYQDIILDYCGCQTPLYFVRAGMPVCNLTNVIVDNCVLSLPQLKAMRYAECDVMCPVPCSETKYEASFSYTNWPTKKADDFIKQRMAKSNTKYNDVERVEGEFGRIQIYFTDLMYQYVEQQRAYESMNLISDLGGQLGLWLGLSAITLGELCSFLFSLGRSLPHTCCESSNKKAVVNPTLRQPATLEDIYDEMNLKDMEDPPRVVTVDNLLNGTNKKPG